MTERIMTLPWKELHLVKIKKRGKRVYIICPFCPFKLQVKPEWKRIRFGAVGVVHRGWTEAFDGVSTETQT